MITEQLKLFFVCVCIGLAGGLARDAFAVSVSPFRDKKSEGYARFAYEICFFVAFAFSFIALQAKMAFPDFRGYMAIGLAVGFCLYYKFLHFLLAFFKKVCYNMIRKNANVKTLKNKR